MKKASLELASRQLLILILVIVIAAVVLILIFNFMGEGKEFVMNLGSGGMVTNDLSEDVRKMSQDGKLDFNILTQINTLTRYFKS